MAANVERQVVTDYGPDPYGSRIAGALASQNALVLEGRAAPGSVRFGATPGVAEDFYPLMLSTASSGAADAVRVRKPTGGPGAKVPGDQLQDLLGEAGL